MAAAPIVNRAHPGVVAAVINYNTAALTLRCVRSLLDADIAKVLVLDNASSSEDLARLRELEAMGEGVRLLASSENLGFAAGSNRLVDEALRDPACERVLLVNSDAVAAGEGLAACLAAMREGGHDLMGGRMLKPATAGKPPEVDSLGIALYKSLLASNRKTTDDAYLGPTGGFAIYSRAFLEEVVRLHGYVFDASYFCYAEDTDLCVRARLLGRSAGYVDEVVAHHEGQGSTTGGYSDFILYHGIRNSIWMVAKSMPAWIVVSHLPWIVLLHCGIVARHLREGRWRTLLRLYRDAIAGLPRALRGRRKVQSSRRVTLAQFRACIDRRFYDTRFLAGAWRELFRGAP